MKNEIVRYLENEKEQLPTIFAGIQKAKNIFDEIKDWDDIERIFFYGDGLSRNTIKGYKLAVRNFYEYTNCLHPFSVTPAYIEQFFDASLEYLDRKTCVWKIAGLKKFFKRVEEIVPLYTSPFKLMNAKLLKKLTKIQNNGNSVVALTQKESNTLLDYLRKKDSVKGKLIYAAIFMMLTSGLRANELLFLLRSDLEKIEGQWYANFIGKGNKSAHQPLYKPAVQAIFDYHIAAFNEEPQEGDWLFYSLCTRDGEYQRLSYRTFWGYMEDMSIQVEYAGIFERKIHLHPHIFRASYCTHLNECGLSIPEIQQLSRHASADTLIKHYCAVKPDIRVLDTIYKDKQ